MCKNPSSNSKIYKQSKRNPGSFESESVGPEGGGALAGTFCFESTFQDF